MREIKFRAWIRQGEWDEAGENQTYEMCYDLAFEEFAPINELLGGVEYLMQFTGLKDSKGREIYEGDIVTHQPNEHVGLHKVAVVWLEGSACFWPLGAIEIIGNIYETPELLETK